MLSGAPDHIHGNRTSACGCMKPFLGCEFMLAMHVVMLVVGILFITNFKFRKPKNLTMGAIVVIVAMAVIGILVRHYMRYMSMI